MISSVSPRGNVAGGEPSKYTTKIERDAQGRPITISNPLAHTTKYVYDGDGNIEKLTDGNGHTTTYSYDADDELTKTEAPSKTLLETGYDSEGQVTSQTDGSKHTTEYKRNLIEEVTEEVNPLGRRTKKEYDAAGNLKTVEDPTKRTTTYTYDPTNRLTEINYSSGAPSTIKYEYNKDGDRTVMTDGRRRGWTSMRSTRSRPSSSSAPASRSISDIGRTGPFTASIDASDFTNVDCKR